MADIFLLQRQKAETSTLLCNGGNFTLFNLFDRPKLSVTLIFNEDDIAFRSSSEVQVKPEVHG